jgi:hypothetical protein
LRNETAARSNAFLRDGLDAFEAIVGVGGLHAEFVRLGHLEIAILTVRRGAPVAGVNRARGRGYRIAPDDISRMAEGIVRVNELIEQLSRGRSGAGSVGADDVILAQKNIAGAHHLRLLGALIDDDIERFNGFAIKE